MGILSCYGLWALAWLLISHVFKGSVSSPYIPSTDIARELQPPLTEGFLLGSDLYGRSLFEILSMGLHYSLSVALIVAVSSAFLGLIMGYLAVIGPFWMRIVGDMAINLAFILPGILIAIIFMSFAGESFSGLLVALIMTGWPGYARIARGEIKRVLGLTYVESARAVGMSETRLFFTVIIPAIIPVFFIHVVLGMGGVIINEATLGFLGLGGSAYSWGVLLVSSKMVLLEAPHLVIMSSLGMAGLIIGFNLLGDGLCAYLNPTSDL